MSDLLQQSIHYTGRLAAILLLTTALPVSAEFTPAERISLQAPSLDGDFDDEAWLVYSYQVDSQGKVKDAVIHASNGIAMVDQDMLTQIRALQYHPATRDGKSVEVSMGPVVYTWILDIPRKMSDTFDTRYQEAWSLFQDGQYAAAADIAAELGNRPGRNAYEEVKYHILAASIANRQNDPSIELRHLMRIGSLQELADRNNFQHAYVEPAHYALMLARVQAIQLDNNQLADAEETVSKLLRYGVSDELRQKVQSAQQKAGTRWQQLHETVTQAEITAPYRGGPGTWKSGLRRERFSIRNVKGDISWIFLVCAEQERRLNYPTRSPWVVPDGWQNCQIEVGGQDGTRFELQQMR
ncbi:MAG: energy transducer TonB [Parahaliea sp.]